MKFPVSRIVRKNVKGDPLGFFEDPFCCKISKIDGGTIKKLRKKFEQSHSAEKGESLSVENKPGPAQVGAISKAQK